MDKHIDDLHGVNARTVYEGSNGGASRSYCARLEKRGQIGRIAAQLFRAQKASSRAKVYRGGIGRSNGTRISYRSLAYERKGECLKALCELLAADCCGLCWGWREDTDEVLAPHLLYVDLPQGQVSFHSTDRHVGPDYESEWDGAGENKERIIRFCNYVARGGAISARRDDAVIGAIGFDSNG